MVMREEGLTLQVAIIIIVVVAFETEFGWVLAGSTGPSSPTHHVSRHVSLLTGDDLLRKFWEIEEKPTADVVRALPSTCVVPDCLYCLAQHVLLEAILS